MPEKWTKRSLPGSSGVMNPKPLSSLNHFTVPVAMRFTSTASGAANAEDAKQPTAVVHCLSGPCLDPVERRQGSTGRKRVLSRAMVAPTLDDVQPVENETRDRIITGAVTAIPFVALFVVGW